ncbi:MazG-like family protein [Bombiscardovia coagulans]|uniref:MazG-like family protein n=1 Tax=Bombiscardovia coagulans TaxID=686666 RepID=UPI001FCE58BB|nr:MazG-like family protein [Bombiscardovia coagulans]
MLYPIELADVFTYCIELAALLNLDIDSIVRKKLVKTQHKYPVTQAKGKSNKYRKLQ